VAASPIWKVASRLLRRKERGAARGLHRSFGGQKRPPQDDRAYWGSGHPASISGS
jgi:hypothetical protein